MEPPVDQSKLTKRPSWGEVFRQELAYVRTRWKTVYTRRDKGETLSARESRLESAQAGAGASGAAAGPTAGNDLVGLAFSGGGIRSATINLGVAQALHRRGALDHVDYVSTVSGGGYLGSSLSTIMRDGAEFPYEHREGPAESPYLTWLRNHSNYLAERGFLDFARGIAVTLRGILINFLVLVPLMLLLAAGLAVYFGRPVDPGKTEWSKAFLQLINVGVIKTWELPPKDDDDVEPAAGGAEGAVAAHASSGDADADGEEGGEERSTGPRLRDVYGLTIIAASFALLYVLAFPVVVRVFKILGSKRSAETGSDSSVKLRDRFERSFSAVGLTVVGLAVIESLPILLYYFHEFQELKTMGGYRNLFSGVAGGTSVISLTMSGWLLERFKGSRTLVLWIVSLLGLLLPLLFVLHVAEALIWNDGKIGLASWLIFGVFIALLVAGSLSSLAARLVERAWAAALAGIVGFFVALVVIFISAYFGRLGDLSEVKFVLALAVAIWLFCWLGVDVNLTSIHGFYRDRLASAYLVGVDTDRKRGAPLDSIALADVDIEQDLNLQDICQGERKGESPSIAPYHIVNVTHNLQKSKDPSIRERNSDFFMFSKKFYGGPRTGFAATRNLEAVFPQMDLATAMAISAAAAAPNMGGGTIRSLVAILTLLNVRLGYWVPNPKHLAPWAEKKGGAPKQTLWSRFWWRIPPRAFLREMISELDEEWRWINLSDGGHLENLALYELLRRRCKYIIAGDGEADPAIHFGSLAKLKRFARIDLGIEIDILLDDVRQGEDRLSHQHCALGRITYPETDAQGEHETGYLLYLKSSMTGDEDEVIREYRANHPTFPHESTADQFFDEGQFEAYRALGYHIADGLFDADQSVADFAAFEKWFADLENNLAPTLAAESLFLELQEELSEIQGLLQLPEYAHFFDLLHPELAAAGGPPPAAGSREAADRMRRNDFLVGQQLRLLENVFVALALERPRNRTQEGNRGWMTLFHDWADAWKRDPAFLEAYRSKSRFLTKKLDDFCTQELGLPPVQQARS